MSRARIDVDTGSEAYQDVSKAEAKAISTRLWPRLKWPRTRGQINRPGWQVITQITQIRGI